MVGFDTSDDAAVYRMRDDLALVQTLDFITPIVDDPFRFGRIAAANSLSDVYAMGARPISALNICCFPGSGIPPEQLREILKGGLAALRDADALLVGGHTVKDQEVKYGLSVLGEVHPDEVKTNSGAKEGDVIVLTKPIGTGILTTAGKKGLIPFDELESVLQSMECLNRGAAECFSNLSVHAVTDVTGFGLALHLAEVSKASGVEIRLEVSKIPFFAKTLEFIREGVVPGMIRSNQEMAERCVVFEDNVPSEFQLACLDPQTSGGLVVSLAEKDASTYVQRLKERNISAQIIATVQKGSPRVLVQN